MAVQLCHLFEPARSSIFKTITNANKTQTLYKFTQLSEDQAIELLVIPLSAVANSEEFKERTIFVIIDGIDELQRTTTIGTNAPAFIAILGFAISQLPSNIRILVFSRPENYITRALTPFNTAIHRLPLPMAQMLHDVNIFLQAKTPPLAECARLQNWPSREQLDIIRTTAHGHMAIAKLSLVWIITEVDRPGPGRRMRGDLAFKTLEAVENGNIYDFYGKVLLQALPDESDPLLQKTCTFILASLVFALEETVGTITSLCLELDSNIEPDIVDDFLSDIRSIAIQSHTPITNFTIPSPHKTLRYFLTSIHPPERFRVNEIQWHNDCATITFSDEQPSASLQHG